MQPSPPRKDKTMPSEPSTAVAAISKATEGHQ